MHILLRCCELLQGDYYSYSSLNGSSEDVALLNVDKSFNLIYKDFVTGPKSAEDKTWGSFGVDFTTGPGHAVLTNTWACAAEGPLVDKCVDSWTGIPLEVPLMGLTPYPADNIKDEQSNAFVTITPVAMTTVGADLTSGTVKSTYDDGYKNLAVPISGNPMHAGKLSDQCMLMSACRLDSSVDNVDSLHKKGMGSWHCAHAIAAVLGENDSLPAQFVMNALISIIAYRCTMRQRPLL